MQLHYDQILLCCPTTLPAHPPMQRQLQNTALTTNATRLFHRSRSQTLSSSSQSRSFHYTGETPNTGWRYRETLAEDLPQRFLLANGTGWRFLERAEEKNFLFSFFLLGKFKTFWLKCQPYFYFYPTNPGDTIWWIKKKKKKSICSSVQLHLFERMTELPA